RDRARGSLGRAGARQLAPDGSLAAPYAHAAGPLRDPHAQRDRPQREPLEPLPPRAGAAPAKADPRGLPEARDGPVPRPPGAAATAGKPALSREDHRDGERREAD